MPSLPTSLPRSPRPMPVEPAASRPRGQVVVIFAGAMLLFVAPRRDRHRPVVVLDQQPAHAARRRLPRRWPASCSCPARSARPITVARAEATKNGYEHGVGGVVVTPVQDPTNDRRLFVTITGPVGTYFARAVGITSWNAARTAKADYVLPVPMGSPQNYYGVGFYEARVPTTNLIPGNTDWNTTGQSVSRRPVVEPGSGVHEQRPVHDRGHQRPRPGVDELRPPDRDPERRHARHRRPRGPPAGRPADRQRDVRRQLPHARRLSAGTAARTGPTRSTRRPLTTSDTDPVIGSNSEPATWTPHTTWTRNEFANGTFRVRLDWNDAHCAVLQRSQRAARPARGPRPVPHQHGHLRPTRSSP